MPTRVLLTAEKSLSEHLDKVQKDGVWHLIIRQCQASSTQTDDGPTIVFENVGIMLRGSVRKPTILKCVFVSMSVKAVHLELVSDLTFIACLRRFIARRGKPTSGTTPVLKETLLLYHFCSSDRLAFHLNVHLTLEVYELTRLRRDPYSACRPLGITMVSKC